MKQHRRTIQSRIRLGAITWVAFLVGLRLLILQPERCGAITAQDVRTAAAATVGWLTANQAEDGEWLYRYDARADKDLGGYNITRHAGLTLSLYQAGADGLADALETADRGSSWLLERLVEAGGGVTVDEPGASTVPVGASALWAVALAERRLLTGEDHFDEVLRGLGTFLASQVEASGAVSERWSRQDDSPVAGSYSVFYTGEAYFALARLGRIFPGEGFGDAADRVGHYLATERDDAEDRFPPVSDHWAAYGLSETAQRRHLDATELEYAVRLGKIFGPQIRYASQRTESWFTHRTRGRQTLGAGLGTLGEGTTSLWLVTQLEDDASGLEAAAERSRCVAGLLVERQIDAVEAREFADPERVAGAWFQFGVTQMDDQQHTLSALIRTLPILEGGT